MHYLNSFQAENNFSEDNGEIKELQDQVRVLEEKEQLPATYKLLQAKFADVEKLLVTKRLFLLESRLFYRKN